MPRPHGPNGRGGRAGGADVDDAAHHDVVALLARRLEDLRRGVEAEERVEEAQALRWATAAARLAEACARKREAAEQGRRRDYAESEHNDTTARRSCTTGHQGQNGYFLIFL
ncbi:hypothetical protein E2562_022027 [Oryza meyeriana var. granulata]|uniref:Uncharacterized protein n=1 Tax=Oryza meyeriana var. granulata TaxID=110450 RepID=A0A6G1ENH9_9ORYZ|nr:hypothetical protein E2562_022027 [Oryza meyeriana var. granulata]